MVEVPWPGTRSTARADRSPTPHGSTGSSWPARRRSQPDLDRPQVELAHLLALVVAHAQAPIAGHRLTGERAELLDRGRVVGLEDLVVATAVAVAQHDRRPVR